MGRSQKEVRTKHSPESVKYFSEHKEENMYVRKETGVDEAHGQWQHFLLRSEINDVVKDCAQTNLVVC